MDDDCNQSEYALFSYVSKKLRSDADQIKLMTKIYNRDSPKSDLLSLVWSTNDDQCYAYGHNGSGCLGLNIGAHSMIKKPTIIKQLSGKKLIKLCSGNRFVLALTDQGQCYSWGDNKFGQLGLSKSLAVVAKPTRINFGDAPEKIIDVSCGLHHCLLLTVCFNLYSFGSNLTGAIGNGTKFHQLKPFLLTDLADHTSLIGADIVQIACGGWHSAAVNLKGDLFAWGWNQTGQCANEDGKSNILQPTKIHFGKSVQTVRCGQNHTLILCYDGQVFAFGSNQHGQCGQDMVQVSYCSAPTLVNLDDRIEMIGAWAKSDLSVAQSCNNGTFFVWGATTTGDNISAQQNPIKKINASNGIDCFVSNNRKTINWIMSKFETSQFTDDNRNLVLNGVQHDSCFPLNRILIVRTGSPSDETNHSANGLLSTFNNANECDLIFDFGGQEQLQQKPPSPTQIDHHVTLPMKIFVQSIFLDNYHPQFIKNLPKCWIVEQVSDETEMVGQPQQHQELNDCVLQDDDCPLSVSKSITLTVNKQKKRFQRICLDGTQISSTAFYSYLLYLYSSNQFIIMAIQDLISLLQIAEKMQDESLTKMIIGHIEHDVSGNLEQICSLYCQSISYGLSFVQEFCCRTMLFCMKSAQQNTTGEHSLARLYRNRNQSYDLELIFKPNETGTENIIKCHRLVLKSGSNFYTQQSFDQRSKQINLSGGKFSSETFDFYVYHVYHGQFPYNLITLEQMIRLLSLVICMGETVLEEKLINMIKPKVTIDNLCQFYIQYNQWLVNMDDVCQRTCTEIFSKICMDTASMNLEQFLCGEDFYRMLAEGEFVRNFLLNLSLHLKRKHTTTPD